MTSIAHGRRLAFASAALIAGVAIVASITLPAGCDSGTAPATAGPGTPPLPTDGYWFGTDSVFETWIGKRWNEIPLIQWLAQAPTGVEQGTRYVVFYSRTCDHCETMFNQDLAPKPEFARQVTLVEVPAEKDLLRSPDAWSKPAVESEELALPLGVNWIITTPLSVRVVDGVITCAEEGGHRECLELDG